GVAVGDVVAPGGESSRHVVPLFDWGHATTAATAGATGRWGAGLPRARQQSGYADGGSRGREGKDLIVGAELPHGAVAPAGRRLSVDPRIAPTFHSPAVDVEDPVVSKKSPGPPSTTATSGSGSESDPRATAIWILTCQPGPKALRSASATRRTAAACRAACGSLQTSSPPTNSTPSSSWSNPRAMRRSYSARVHRRVRTCRTPIIPPRPEAIGRLRR